MPVGRRRESPSKASGSLDRDSDEKPEELAISTAYRRVRKRPQLQPLSDRNPACREHVLHYRSPWSQRNLKAARLIEIGILLPASVSKGIDRQQGIPDGVLSALVRMAINPRAGAPDDVDGEAIARKA